MQTRRFYTRYLPALMLILILVASAFAFANTNTVDESGAGDGANTISGYNITAIRYTLNGTTPTTLDAVRFNVVPLGGQGAPTTVQVQLNAGGSWYSCANTVGNTWSCDLSAGGLTVSGANNLRVLAVQ